MFGAKSVVGSQYIRFRVADYSMQPSQMIGILFGVKLHRVVRETVVRERFPVRSQTIL
jgi:hypothetical protein